MSAETYLLEHYLKPKRGQTPLADVTRNDGRAWITELMKTERKLSAAEGARRRKALAADPKTKIERHYLSAASVRGS